MRRVAMALVAAFGAGCLGSGSPTVEMKNIEFVPEEITIDAGQTVLWRNRDALAHTVTPVNVTRWGTAGSGDAEAYWLGPGATWSFTFTTPGRFEYYCIPHAAQGDEGRWVGQTGVVIVRSS